MAHQKCRESLSPDTKARIQEDDTAAHHKRRKLISIGMVMEDQRLIRKCFVCFHFYLQVTHSTNCVFVRFIADAVESKMGLVHEDDVDWFLTLDETHHELSTVGMRGSAAAGRYINPPFPQSGE